MTELIKITEQDGKQAVSARELYNFLGFNKTQWKRWYEKNIIKNPYAEEHSDWKEFDTMSNGNQAKDFVLSLDFAKRLAMLARTDKGETIRKYFIACEKKLKEGAKPLSTIDILELTIKGLRENQQDLQEVKQEIKELKAKTTTRPEYFTIAGYGTLNGIHINIKEAQSLGQKASRICKEKGIPTDETPDPRFGKVKMYPQEVLEKVFAMAIN